MYVRCPFLFHCPISKERVQTIPVFISSFFFRVISMILVLMPLFFFLSSLLILVILHPGVCSARKMFPKRKLDESRSGSESQKEEADVKDKQGQQNKRPRVEPGSPASEGMLSLLL